MQGQGGSSSLLCPLDTLLLFLELLQRAATCRQELKSKLQQALCPFPRPVWYQGFAQNEARILFHCFSQE